MKRKKYIDLVKRSNFLAYSRLNKVRLDKNEKIDKFSKEFFKNLKHKLNSDLLTAYPEVYPLVLNIAKKYNIKKKNILVTSGIDSALKTIIEGYTNKKDLVAILEPTFAMTNIYCKLANLKIIKIKYDNNLNLDLKKLFKNINKNLRLVILSNPNSPTGTIIDKKDIKKILEKTKKFNIPVIIDEAYYGFTKQTAINLISKYKNLFVTRTFSKMFGLAGLRVGFIASNSKNIEYISKLKPMYETNSVAIEAAKILLKKSSLVKKYVDGINFTKSKLITALEKNNLSYFKTYANFMLINFKSKKKRILQYASKNNILISKNLPFKNYIRITLGPYNYFKGIIKIINN